MERVGLDDIEREIDAEARERFPGDAVRQVVLQQYGDDPEIEPGDLWVTVQRQLVGGVLGRLRCCTCVLYGAWPGRHVGWSESRIRKLERSGFTGIRRRSRRRSDWTFVPR
jgi:hypothetical protein